MTIKQPVVLDATRYKRPIRIETGGAVALTHQAIVADNAGIDRRAYVKHFPNEAPRGMFNEWVGYTIMSALGIPQPDAALLPAPIGGNGPTAWAFVSFAPTPTHEGTPKEIYNCATEAHLDILAERLLACHSFAAMVAADQLCINGDRNLGNLVFTGKRTFVVIDHGDILGGRDWEIDSLIKPTGWVKSVPVAFCRSMGKIKDSHRSAIYAASQVCSEQIWNSYPELKAALSSDSREPWIALDAVWWRSLSVAKWFRDELQLML